MSFTLEKSCIRRRRKFSFLNTAVCCHWEAHDAVDIDASLTTFDDDLSDSYYLEMDNSYDESDEEDDEPRVSMCSIALSQRMGPSHDCKDREQKAAATDNNDNLLSNFAQARMTTFSNNIGYLRSVTRNIRDIGIAETQVRKESAQETNAGIASVWQARAGTFAKNLETLSSVFQS